MDGNGFLAFLTASMEMVFIPFTMVVKLPDNMLLSLTLGFQYEEHSLYGFV